MRWDRKSFGITKKILDVTDKRSGEGAILGKI